MKKNKLVLGLSIVVSLLFVIFLIHTAIQLGKVDENLEKSPNIQKVTDKLETRLLITDKELNPKWIEKDYDDSSWKVVHIPKTWILSDPDYKAGSYAYYRIKLLKESIQKISHLKNESVLNLYIVNFSRVDSFANGAFIGTNKPKSYNEAVLDVPIKEEEDNLIAIKGYIKTGDLGLNHRGDIFAGKKAELNELHRKSYKGIEVYGLLFLMSKGSIFLIFTLIFIIIKTEKYFEYSLLFSLFVLLEDVVVGDYISAYLNFERQVFLYDIANIGFNVCLYLFFNFALERLLNKKIFALGVFCLVVIVSLISVDLLYVSKFFTADEFLKFWNCILMLTILYFVPKLFQRYGVLSMALSLAVVLIGWSTFFASSMTNNFKAFANLLIFICVAYQTFVLLRKQQDQLVEQEKDVAIGRTAAILAHDVRRPLDQMNVLLNRMSEGEFDKEFLKVAKQDIQFSLNAVNNQISDIMNFNRNSKVDLKPISLYEVLAGSLKQVLSVLGNVKIDLVYEFEADRKIMGEESRLTSAITNVLVNSVEAIRDIGKMSQGRIDIKVTRAGHKIVLKVINNGPQIPPEVLPNIFKPLYTTGKKEGTGLGLASVMKIMKDHNGAVEINNVPQGVEYQLSFQSAVEEDRANTSEFKGSSTEYSYVESKYSKTGNVVRVFLLDDDKYVFEYLKDLSQKADFEVELYYFNNINEGKQGLLKKRYDLHIVDYDLADEKTGLQFIEDELLKLNSVVALHTGRVDLNNDNSKIELTRKPISLASYNKLLEKADKTRLRILLIEDSKLIGVAWKVFHGSSNIVVCSTPEEGIEYFRNNVRSIDLCLIDNHFDNSTIKGSELILKIRQINPSQRILSISSAGNDLGVASISKGDYEIRTKV